jgi:hypothetical protein
MKLGRIIIAVATLGAIVAADPAIARARQKAKPQCVDGARVFSWSFLLPGSPAPQPNGCSPPVYAYGKFIGQDADRNIRHQLQRDPATGYSAHQN